MAQKEATVYIVDVGVSMGETSHGRSKSNLDWALDYVYDKISSTVATGRKTAMVGVVALRTNDTANDLGEEDAYQHISVLQEISQIQMPQLRRLRQHLVVSKTENGDAISALVVAVQMILKHCKKLQYQRKIVLVTDARAPMESDDLSQIVSKVKQDGMELVILGVDFDDPEYGFKEEDKDGVKAQNEETLKTLCGDCGGIFGTLAQATDELGIPRLKSTRPVPSYKGYLTLGNPEEYETAFAIGVERYPKTMIAKPPTASSFVIRNDMASGEATQSTATLADDDEAASNGDGLAAVKNARTYQVTDENAPGGKRDVELDELAKGYEYGRTAVHISESDRNVTDYETSPGLEIIGFVEKNQYERHMDMSRANLIVANRSDEKAGMSLSSLIHALYELDSYAVARYVAKEAKPPLLLLLVPNIEPDLECLYDVELPFAEDLRSYKFPPLDRVVTVSGKELKIHRNLPSEELVEAMSDYVDAMDLSTFGKDDEGEDAEYAPPDETFSPMLHRINQVIKHRAIYPDQPPPEPYEILTRFSQPPRELLTRSKAALDRVLNAADIKKVPPKARGKRYGRKREQDKPLSNLDVDALLQAEPQRKKKQVDPDNPIPSFKQFIASGTEEADISEACRQLGVIIEGTIRHSTGDSGYGRALEAIGEMRSLMIDLEEPLPYNNFMRGLKKNIMDGKLGGDRLGFWHELRKARMRLLSTKECPQENEVSEEEAAAFLSLK